MGCSKRVCAGLAVGGITLALLGIAFLLPWYYISTVAEIGEDCAVEALISWDGVFCESEGCNNAINFQPCFFVNEENRSLNGTSIEGEGVQEVFQVTAAMLAVSAAATLFVITYFVLRVFNLLKRTAMRIVCFVIGIFGLLALAGAVIYFAVGIPSAIRDAQEFCPEQIADPCNTFFGAKDRKIWGGVGWFFGIITWPMMLVLVILVIVRCKSYSVTP